MHDFPILDSPTMHTLLNRRRKVGKGEYAVSANMAYVQVTLGPTQRGEYEDPDKLATRSKLSQVNHEFPVGKSDAPVYATVEEATAEKNISMNQL